MAMDPTKHENLVTSKNKRCDQRVAPSAKMAKGINAKQMTRSSHLSCLKSWAFDLLLSLSTVTEMRFVSF